MSTFELEDLELAIRNKDHGIREYLNSLGKLWVTPFGCFTTLKQIQNITGLRVIQIQRKLNSKRAKYSGWYVIDGDSPLHPAEDCMYCDELDDSLFYEECWLCNVDHKHNEPLKDDDEFTYLFNGKSYTTTVGQWEQGIRLHKEIGENFDD